MEVTGLVNLEGTDMPRKLPRFLSPQEVNELFRVASASKRDMILLKCLFHLGLRNSEAQKLEVGNIDHVNQMVKVVQGKGKTDRYVPIPAAFAGELKGFMGERDSGLLFGGRGERGAMSDRHIRRIVKHYAKLARIRKCEEIHPHTLRHSYATFLHNRRVPLNEIQSLLGHKNIETTTIYTHLGIENLKRSVDMAFG